ncbi:MAG: ycdT 2 [Devosia sp.]|nr:ycdT 2 [Devosia sp.]
MTEVIRNDSLSAPVMTSIVRLTWTMLIVFLLTASLCLLGAATRPVGFLAGFWPANAVTAAIFLRYPPLFTPLNWVAAVFGFVVADLASGNDMVTALSLTGSNFAGILTASIFLKRLGSQATGLKGGMSILAIFFAAVLAAAATSIMGSHVSALLFGVPYANAFMFCFSNEWTNYVTFIPLVLAFPANFRQLLRRMAQTTFTTPWTEASYQRLFAFVLLILLGYGSHLISGSGAFVFPLPALILMAMLYPVFVTVGLVLLYTVWCQSVFFLDMIYKGVAGVGAEEIMSVRFAITLVALGPLTVACMNAAREALRIALDQAATTDDLTGVLNRRAFFALADDTLHMKHPAGTATVVLMLDIDHFKSINDRFGHSAGDDALKAFTKLVESNLRSTDLLGRLGGEEFAIIARTGRLRDGDILANRIREAVKQHTIRTVEGSMLSMSIGGVARYGRFDLEIEEALNQADAALYKAKNAGRDQVIITTA